MGKNTKTITKLLLITKLMKLIAIAKLLNLVKQFTKKLL